MELKVDRRRKEVRCLIPNHNVKCKNQAGAYLVKPGTRSKSVSLLATLLRLFACMRATINASPLSNPVCWLIIAAETTIAGVTVRNWTFEF